jgi:SNF2 family DNA or RNA helicase
MMDPTISAILAMKSTLIADPTNQVDQSYLQACLDALNNQQASQSFASNSPISSATASKCDPTALIRLSGTKQFGDQARQALASINLPFMPKHLSDQQGCQLKLALSNNQLFKLHAHQIDALKYLQNIANEKQLHNMCGAVAVLSMGLGKTVVALLHAMMLSKASMELPGKQAFPSLIVASKSVADMWLVDGFEKFLLNAKTLWLHSSNKQLSLDELDRQQVLKYDFVLTTYDVVMRTADKHSEVMQHVLEFGQANTWGENPNAVKQVHARKRQHANQPSWTGAKLIFGTPWECVVCDESQRFANPKTKIFQAIMAVYGRHKLCLTGTPIRNFATDMWSQLRWLGYTGICQASQWRPHYMEAHKLSTRVLVVDAEDTQIVMPKCQHVTHSVQLTEIERQVYTFLKEQVKVALDLSAVAHLEYICVLALFTRLRQCCIAPHLLTKSDVDAESYVGKVMQKMHQNHQMASFLLDKSLSGLASTKMLKIAEIIQHVHTNLPGDKILVFSMWVSVLQLVSQACQSDKPNQTGKPINPIQFEMLHGQTSDRQAVLRRFKTDPACKVLFATYGVAGEGLNLVEANHVICVEPWWTYAVQDQAIARAARPGQTKTVVVHRVEAEETIEQRILALCDQKRAVAQRMLSSAGRLANPVASTPRIGFSDMVRLLS